MKRQRGSVPAGSFVETRMRNGLAGVDGLCRRCPSVAKWMLERDKGAHCVEGEYGNARYHGLQFHRAVGKPIVTLV
jgi:hypothetical protein